MKIINKSRKIIGINGEPLLPGKDMVLPDGMEKNPCVADYLAKGIVADADKDTQNTAADGVSDFERAKIAEEAIAKYKAEQEALAKYKAEQEALAAAQAEKEALAAAQAEKEAEINAVKGMKKAALLKKAAGMEIEVKDDDTEETVREKILAALEQ
jgi:hypothetical protein